jgi:hypothetical protein
MSGAASSFAGRGRSERPISRTKRWKLALARPNLSCLSPVCWLFRLRSVEPPQCKMPAFRDTADRRARSPSVRGAFIKAPCPRRALPPTSPSPLAQPSCVPLPPPPLPTTNLLDRGTPASLVAAPLHHTSDLAPDPRTCCLTFAFTSAADPGCTAATPSINRPSLRHLPARRHHHQSHCNHRSGIAVSTLLEKPY